MSDTNSFRSQALATDLPQASGNATAKILDPSGQALGERLGVGGMGEVYRFGDEALQRDLAIKILKEELRGSADAEERFLREARLTGSLQHPGVVPIHNLSRLADSRPCYTMKLVRGRTFADMLRDEPPGPERLPRLLAILEKVCQAVAYAHSKHVIHRDLKPSNVMVGEFGEVQVMDWGLAKELSRSEPAPPPESTENVETAAWMKEDEGLSRAGSALGTPAYMPPEQAAGDWDIVDERADVFALGAILCEMLTGHPPYHGANREDLLRRGRRRDMAEALGRLEKCGADTVLVDLCSECLAAERLQRPRHAGVVAERLASYQAEVRERLRQAELERARAEVKALEQRKRRRLLAALALMAMVFLASGAGGLWWRQSKQDRADQAALTILDNGRKRLDEGWRLHDLAILKVATGEAERAADIASGGVSAAVEQQVADFRTAVSERLARAEKNRQLLNALLDIAMPHETKTYKEDESSQKMQAVAEPSVEEQYDAAFRRRWPDIEIEKQAESAVASRLQEEPEVVLQGVIAGLDSWMLEQRRQNRAETKWRHLLGVVERLDHSEPRRQLRALLIGAVPPRPEDVAELLGGRPPWIALWKLGRGSEWRQLRQLRGRMDVSVEPVLTVLLLAQVSGEVGDVAGAEAVLRQALARRPDEAVLLDALGKVLFRQGSSRLDEAIGYYRAIRAKHPEQGLILGRTLIQRGRWGSPFFGARRGDRTPAQAGLAAEGEAILRDLIRQQPKNPEILIALGYSLYSQEKLEEAETAYRKVIAIQPDHADARRTLGGILSRQRKYPEEEAVYRSFIALKPDEAWAYNSLGSVLNLQGKRVEAEAVYRKAIALKPDDVWAYHNLAGILNNQGKYADAEAVYRKAIAIRLNPPLTHDLTYISLGDALRDQKKYAEAEAVYRKAIALSRDHSQLAYMALESVLKLQGKPSEEATLLRKAIAAKPHDAAAYRTLGSILSRQGKHAEADAVYRKAIELRPDDTLVYSNLASALRSQGKNAEAEAVYRKAIALRPDVAMAYRNLGGLLNAQGKHAEAEAAYRKAIALSPNDIMAHTFFGDALRDQKKYAEAETAYRKAIALQPDFDWALNRLDSVLKLQGKPLEAETAFRKAITLRPGDHQAYGSLGRILNEQGKHAEAEAAFRKIIALQPRYLWAYNNLGEALLGQGKNAEAEAIFRKAIDLNPTFSAAHNNLGRALYAKGDLDGAIVAYRKAIELNPRDTWPHNNLGLVLYDKGDLHGAIACYKKALALDPKNAYAHNSLGLALYSKGDLDGAIPCYKRAVELDPKYAWPHNNLGLILYDNGDLDGAITCYKKALELDPKNNKAHYNLANALLVQRKHVEAEAAYRKIIALQPDDTWAHINLGSALQGQQRFAESLTAYRRGHELGSKQPGWRYPSLHWVRSAERFVKLEKKLDAILQGKASPANADETVAAAGMCSIKKRHLAAVRFYTDAFTTEPKLADDMNLHYRYYAACSAALAAAGQGEDARQLPDKTVARLRQRALGWLRDHLTANAKLAEQNDPAENQMIQYRLAHWRRDPDLASVRDSQAIDRLPDRERAVWQALWRDVDELAKRVAKTDGTKPVQKNPKP